MKSRLRFVILPFFTLCRIHCLSMSETECDECCLNKFLWMWSVHGKKKERSNIINHCVCIQMSGYWLIIFNFVIFRSLITQWFFFASLEDGKVLNEMESKCDFTYSRRDYWIEIKMLKAIDDDNINLSFFFLTYRSLEPGNC